MPGFNPGDVIIGQALISGDVGSVDITRRIMNMAVYEHLSKPYTSVSLMIQDNADILNNNLFLNGNNSFTVSFGQPGQDPYTGTWVLTAVEKSRSTQNQRTVIYQATGYSPHMLNIQKVQRAFRDVTTTDAISSLVQQVLQPIKPFLVNAPARNMTGNQNMPYNINGVQIFKAIGQLMHHSASTKDQSSAYVMFENNKSLVLDTLENLMNSATGGPTYYQRPLGTNFLQDVARQQFTILSYREESRVDKSTQISGANQQTRVYDIFAQAFKQQNFGSGLPATFASLAYNIMRPPSFAQSYMAPRAQVAGQFDTQALTIHVPLNPALTVGSCFVAQILAPLGETSTAVIDNVSGNQLITEACHRVDLSGVRMAGTSTVKGVSQKGVSLQ
jgi:hypothetical protein